MVYTRLSVYEGFLWGTPSTAVKYAGSRPYCASFEEGMSEFTELAKSRFLDCDSCGMTQGALIRYVADP